MRSWGWSPHDGMSPWREEEETRAHALSQMRTQEEALGGTKPAGPLILDIQPPPSRGWGRSVTQPKLPETLANPWAVRVVSLTSEGRASPCPSTSGTRLSPMRGENQSQDPVLMTSGWRALSKMIRRAVSSQISPIAFQKCQTKT